MSIDLNNEISYIYSDKFNDKCFEKSFNQVFIPKEILDLKEEEEG